MARHHRKKPSTPSKSSRHTESAPSEFEHLGGLAIEKSERISEYKRRKPRFLQKKAEPADIGTLVEDGWIERRKVAGGKILFEKSKTHDEILENRFWGILYQLGFEELNKGRNFKINVVSEGHIVNKQVDVFAKVGNTVVVAECKSSARRGQRNLQKDIGELGSLQRSIANSLRKHYGAESRLKIIWLMVTSNVNWSNSDKARAADQGIQIVRERELRYFEEIAKNVGPAAKYQFIGEFLSSQEIPELSNYSVPAIRTKLGGQWAYYFLAAPDRILPIAFVNHRGLRDVEGAPSYQRVLKRSRLKEIGSYLDGGGFFPNCILINFRQSVRFQRQTSVDDRQISFGNLFLPDRYKSAWVIDGQHRLYGFTESETPLSKQSIPILAFEKLSTLAEAELFTTINSKQQKVARGLLDELAGELKLDSEDFDERMGAIASRSLDIMATETGNPFEDRIKTADLADSDTICLTISELKKAIISSKMLGARSRNDVITPGEFSRSDTEETLHAICEGLTAYFSLIQEANVERWEQGRPGCLCSNIAIQGYIRLLPALCSYMQQKTHQSSNELDPVDLIDQIKPYLQPVIDFVSAAEDSEFLKRFKVPFGSGGPPRYFYQLSLLVRSKFADFDPPGFSEFDNESRMELKEVGDSLVASLLERIHDHVVLVLKQNYGTEFFDVGIPDTKIKIGAMQKKYENGEDKKPPETFLNFIDLKSIVEHKKNWDLFKENLSIRMEDEKGGNQKYLGWMVKLNEIRRVLAHSYGRSYSEDQVQLLEFLDEQLAARNV